MKTEYAILSDGTRYPVEKRESVVDGVDFSRMTFPQAEAAAPILGEYFGNAARQARIMIALDDAWKAGMREATK